MKTKSYYFDNNAESWDGKNRDNEKIIVSKIFEEYVHELRDNILDLGCGTGFLVPFIKRNSSKNSRLYCSDISSQMLNRLNERSLDCSIIRSDAHFLPFNNSTFSNIFCYNVFPHFENKPKMIDEFRRLLKRGGRVYVMHNMDHKKLNSMHSMKGREVSQDLMLSVSELREAFIKKTFKIVHSEETEGRYILIAQN